MADSELKDFLRQQARSLDNLLALTPAKNMFGEDVSDQWKRKKQTPEQKKAARIAKLNPANWKSAKDVYDERNAAAKKRKRGQGGAEAEETDNKVSIDGVGTKNKHESKRAKTQSNNDNNQIRPTNHERIENVAPDEITNPNLKKRMKKRLHAKEKKQQLLEQKTQEKSTTSQHHQSDDTSSATVVQKKSKHDKKPVDKAHLEWESLKADKQILEDQTSDAVSESALEEEDDVEDNASTAPSSSDVPEILSPMHDSASSSVSSIIPPPVSSVLASKLHQPHEATQKDAQPTHSHEDREAARKRLQDQISQFRSQRKADDKPARSRAELLDQRRRKEEERKQAKKEQKRKEREEEARKQDEEMVKRFSPGGSGSLLASPRSPIVDDHTGGGFSFGRIAFEDGTHLDSSTMSAVASQKQKGAADPATALKAAQSKASRIAGLDDTKRQDIEEKEMWLKAKKRAHGERIRDDTSLLKKALKRQEKEKNRSEQEWDKRIEGVKSGQEAKQKKRTENLQKRKDEKLAKKMGKKKVKRPGFEGSFRSRAGKKK